MKLRFSVLILVILAGGSLFSQDATGPAPTPQKKGWMSRVLHPFGSAPKTPTYKNPKLNGLELYLQISPQPVKLSETRQIEMKVTLTNKAKHPIELTFPTDQRIEIYLMNSAEVVLTKWSDNHAIAEKTESVLINQDEHTEYTESIATRELTANKVFIAEVFFPNYPELRVRQKFMTEQ